MNSAGAIVGTVHTPVGDLPSRWFLYERGRFTVLPLADPAGLGGAAIGINRRGDVVGYTHTATHNLTGWLWSDGTYRRLPVSGISTAALGINSGGTVIGNRSLGLITRLLSGRLRAARELGYVVSQGTVRYLSGFAYALNDVGDVVGGSLAGGAPMATLYRDGAATVILRSPSAAVGINSAAEIVGHYDPPGHKRRRLFRWSAGSGALDLTPDEYQSAQAAAINDRGEILAFGETARGISQYFLLTPDPGGRLTPKAIIGEAAAR
jgi:probable HAF family extracellular repeat protein